MTKFNCPMLCPNCSRIHLLSTPCGTAYKRITQPIFIGEARQVLDTDATGSAFSDADEGL